MADNAIYTPNPKTIDVVVFRDYRGIERVTSLRRRDLASDDVFIRQETAKVVGRGNLIDDCTRWYEVELADGSRVMVTGEGS